MPNSRRPDINAATDKISKGLQDVGKNIVLLGRALQSLMTSGVASGSRRGGRRSAMANGRSARRRKPLTAADRARLRVQGEYLGLVRHLSPRNRNRVKSLRSEKGYQPAIRLARRLAKP